MRKKRVIIYEDERVLRDLFQVFFTSLDYDVLTLSEPVICPVYAGNNNNCVHTRPCSDVMITDYFMPRMNGADLILAQTKQGCKLSPRNKAIISGDIDPAKISRVVELGCEYFQKPFPFSELADWVASCEHRIDLAQPLAVQRREERRPFSQEVACRVPRQTRLINGSTVNISASGVCLRLPVPLSEHDQVHFNTALPLPCSSASVRWVTRLDAGQYLTGLQCL